MKTSKRKLIYSAEQSENCEHHLLDSEQNLNKVCNALVDSVEMLDTSSTLEVDVTSATMTPKHRVGLTERQQMSILLQLTTNAQCSLNNVGLSPRTPHGSKPSKAAVKGRRRLVKRGRLLHKRNERGETPLHVASIRGDAKQVQRLVRLGVDVNCPDFAGWTPLHEACNHGWFRVGELLLKAGADVDARGFDDFTPLHDAAVNGHLDLVELLLRHGASLSPKNVNGKTPLSLATCPKIVDLLNEPKFDFEFCASSRTPAAVSRDAEQGVAHSRTNNPTKEQKLTSLPCSAACTISNNMRKSSPQHQTPKGPDKPSSPRLTLRFQPIKSREERHGGGGGGSSSSSSGGGAGAGTAAAAAASGSVGGSGCSASSKTTSEVTSSEPRYQSYCVTMETAEEDDVYEFKKDPSEEGQPPPSSISSSAATHHRPSSSASSTSSVATAAATAVVTSDDPQFNVVSSTKDATLRIQQTINVDSAVTNNNRAKMNENHVIRTGGDKQHKSESHDVADAAAAGKVVVENTNHSRPAADIHLHDVVEGGGGGGGGSGSGAVEQHEDGKRKRKRDAKDETANKTVSAGGGGCGGGNGGGVIGMSLRNHGREKSSPEGRKSPENGAGESVENNAANAGSETESTQSDAENEAPELQEPHAQGGGGLPKVPPLKIVIPPTSSMAEQDRDRSRVASRHSLPYIVNSSEDSKGSGTDGKESNGTMAMATQPHQLPASDSKENAAFPPPPPPPPQLPPAKEDAKISRDGAVVHSEERTHRVTRSSQRMAAMAGGAAAAATAAAAVSLTAQNLQDYVSGNSGDCVKANKFDEGAGSAEEHNGTEMPPRKRKLRPRGSEGGPSLDGGNSSVNHSASSASSSSSSSVSSHYEEQSMYLNCYEMFLNLRRQIDRRHTSMFVVQPKPPQGFKDYLMNKCSYVLAGNAASRLSVPMIPPPQSLTGLMKELYVAQEKARYSLRLQHIIEREKLTLSFEQETLRVHGRAARAMANQAVPLSVCTILKDEEVYNQIEPEQEEKERNARTRFNGRLFLSWLQDVDDKWDKVKKAMLLRHHNEAESLHAAQKLDWEWKLKELGICDTKSTPAIDVIHVPIVHVSDDFDLLPT